ncbi:unnamed protein product [Paramecium primaurelia]|uniref:Profilin n=2 Tax=Paramecium TaxID=5884 RepID=A0A8S1UBX7_9CILI|nr:unnamed protein product [Paramecium primaurelia]CAD8161463.1 unnamed protein product [Paramecium pentaurelia]
MDQGLDAGQLLAELKKQDEWAKAIIFDEDLNVITHKNCAASKEELAPYLKAYDVRDNTIGAGFVLLGEHYEVHRWHPPLVYGRRGDADVGEGISLARGICKKHNGKRVYLLITYELPIVSARAVPQQINFYNQFIGELEKFDIKQQ